jgi:hypothetical protein
MAHQSPSVSYCPNGPPHAVLLRLQLTLDPPLEPIQDHVACHPQDPWSYHEGVPYVQVLTANQHNQLTPPPADVSIALHELVAPPLMHSHTRNHHDEDTLPAVEFIQRFVLGALEKLCQFELPHKGPHMQLTFSHIWLVAL